MLLCSRYIVYTSSSNCVISPQAKYNSRAASLYRDKVHQLATAAMRQHGTSLHLDGGRKKSECEEKEVDFFASITQQEKDAFDDALNSQVHVLFRDVEAALFLVPLPALPHPWCHPRRTRIFFFFRCAFASL